MLVTLLRGQGQSAAKARTSVLSKTFYSVLRHTEITGLNHEFIYWSRGVLRLLPVARLVLNRQSHEKDTDAMAFVAGFVWRMTK